jgi:hypothetical protein
MEKLEKNTVGLFFMNAATMSQYQFEKSYLLDISIYFDSIFIFDHNLEINITVLL